MDPRTLADDLVARGVVDAIQLAWTGGDGVELHTAGAAAPDSRFALASLTKPIVAAACLVACEEGVLDLDAPLALAGNGASLRDVLSHAAGFGPDDGGARRVQLQRESSWADVAAAYRRVVPAAGPRTRRTYSNTAYAIAAIALEDAAGIGYVDYAHAAVLAPLRMARTTFGAAPDDPDVVPVRDPGLLGHGEQLFNGERFRRLGLPQSGAFGSAADYLALMRTVLAGGAAPTGHRILADETCAEMTVNQGGALPGGVGSFMEWPVCDWAIGFELRDAKVPHWTGTALSERAFTHFGSAGTLAFGDPATGRAGVVLANRGTYSRWMLEAGAWPDIVAAMVA